MIDTKALRNKILDLAISGKLTEQLPEDGNAEDLYAQIQEEKARLTAEGKIKKQKPMPPITEDEILFEIPENWKWVRLSEICNQITDGTHKTPKYQKTGVPFISVKNISHGYLDLSDIKYISEKEHNELIKRCKPERGDILICRIGTLGRSLVIKTEYEFSMFVSLGLVKPNSFVESDYLVCALNSGYGYSWIDMVKAGGAMHAFKINLNDLNKFAFPLPPLAEQKRIVSAVENAFAVIDKIEKAQESYYANQEVLKNKIIDAGIRGKLTEQLPEDGNAEDLYAQIQEEKARLIAEGKIKKEKPLPPISEDEIPFEIPKNWKWVRLGEIVRVVSGTSYAKGDVCNNGIRVLRGGNIQEPSVIYEDNDVFVPSTYRDNDKSIKESDVVIVASTGSEKAIGKAGIVRKNDENAQIGAFLRIVRAYNSLTSKYIGLFFLTKMYKNHIRNQAKGTNINNIKESYITEICFPLPPLKEQEMISEAIGGILKTILR